MLRLAVIGGDGIGPEVTAEALKVLAVLRDDVETVDFDLGARRYLATGEILNKDTLTTLKDFDAILLGAIGAPGEVPAGLLERGLLLKLRFELDHHVNLRPSTLRVAEHSPLKQPGNIDFVVVREGTEGLYCGNGGTLRKGTNQEVASEVSQNTRFGVERVVRYAFELATTRRNKVTLVHKKNVLVHAGDLWQRVVDDIAGDYPAVEVEYQHIDAATIYMVQNPSQYDVIVTDNLFGDIITDLAGAVTGGIGLAASGNIDSTGKNPSMFEPVHGSAPDIAGQGVADPTAAISSVALMLRHLGDEFNATAIEKAVAADIEARANGKVITSEVGDRIAEAVRATIAQKKGHK